MPIALAPAVAIPQVVLRCNVLPSAHRRGQKALVLHIPPRPPVVLLVLSREVGLQAGVGSCAEAQTLNYQNDISVWIFGILP